MISSWDVYWVSRLDAVSWVLFVLALLTTLATVVAIIASIDLPSMSRAQRDSWKASKLCAACAVLFTTLFVLTPDSKQAAAILVIPAVVNSKELQGLSEAAVSLANEWIDELRPEGAK